MRIQPTIVFVLALGFALNASAQAPVHILASNGVKAVLNELLKQNEKTVGHPSVDIGTSSVVKQKIVAGESFDVAILTSDVIDDLIKAGKLVAASRTDVARAGIGVGVRRGTKKPDIKTPEAIKATLLHAGSITYAQDGASRPHIEKMMESLGITPAMKAKTVQVQGSDNANKAVTDGKVDMVITLISEILPVSDVELVGPLPQEFQSYVRFAAAVSPSSKNQDAGKALIQVVTSPSAAPIYQAKGMETKEVRAQSNPAQSAFAQTSTSAPATARAQGQKATEARAPAFEYLGTLHAETGTRTVVENGPQGTRTIVQVVGGRFEGPRIKATVQTPAGDWITNRADGSYRLDVRMTLKTDDGAFILVTYNGIGQTTEAGASLRIAPLFETGDSRYVWLTRLQAVGVGERVGTAVAYDIYALK